jgi:phosphoribosylformimino-5-aminoimidazole carboxamide ribotide isomerase
MQTKIYPAIDIIDGQCVRLTKGDFGTSIIYNDNPVDMALTFEAAGATYLHVVDLDAAKNPGKHNRNIIASIIKQTQLKVQVGGGIRNEEDLTELLGMGIDRLIIGSMAVVNPNLVYEWIANNGNHKIVIGADVFEGKIATHGWQNISQLGIIDFISMYLDNGATTFLCTDITKDGMMSGSGSEMYKNILKVLPDTKLIASGGVQNKEEIDHLQSIGMESIVIGKAIYEGKLNLQALFKKEI